jgi:ferredoxin-type protein NapH
VGEKKSLNQKKGARRKTLRYFRWAIKVAFLLILILPIRYFSDPGVYTLPVHFLPFEGFNQLPITQLSYGQSICSFLLFSWSYVGPAGWLICPVGGIEILLTAGKLPQSGLNLDFLTLSLLSAISIFLFSIFLLGPIFCSWICPVGTVVDGFDKGIEKFMPKLNKKREERLKQNLEKNKKKPRFACPTCPFGNFLANKNATVANGILITALAGSAILRFPVWCSICPIGILSQGMFHLKSVTRISNLAGFSNAMMPVLIELWIFPVIAVVLSLKEKRYWCRKICPLGALVRFFARFNPFFKPTVQGDKRVMKGAPKEGEGHRLASCGECSQMDQRPCERVCPQGVGPLKAKGSAECTKCLECYFECEQGMIGIKWFKTPEVVLWLRRFFKKLKKRPKKQKSISN